MDDSMRPTGPTEEDKNFIADTGSSSQDMQDLVDGYQAMMDKYNEAVVAAGGFTWMLARGPTPNIFNVSTEQCINELTSWCVLMRTRSTCALVQMPTLSITR